MRKLVFVMAIAVGTNAFGQAAPKTAGSPNDFIPAGYVVFEKTRGDLNGDGQEDHVFIIKGTNKDEFIKDDHRGVLDRNRRGIIIVFKNQGRYELALENRDCFSSENEDGGVYYAPELGVDISKGALHVHYAHGRYGYWAYKFRYQNSDFELIGFDSSSNHGPVTQQTISINLASKKVRVQDNINKYGDVEDEKLVESWKKFKLSNPIKLREIKNFDSYDLVGSLGLSEWIYGRPR